MVIVFAMALCWMVLTLVLAAGEMEAASDHSITMSNVNAHYGKTLEMCREEAQISPEIMQEWHHIWDDDFEVVQREIGCAIICMSHKFSLLQDDNRMHHESMFDYIRSFDNGDVLSATVVELFHNCEKQYEDIEDDCSRVTKVMACFKVEAKKAGIAPEVAMIEAVLEKY
ncbi:general odorant-binding protein 2-like [Cydia pomonella]|uniref:general odorant-binding protein 2-like n=1 Tax=Cydia pomonella TaxID=82600 RepID=UPI002ADDC9F7|nr:general odorant-binding protein 2-like [Cydia pomonella]